MAKHRKALKDWTQLQLASFPAKKSRVQKPIQTISSSFLSQRFAFLNPSVAARAIHLFPSAKTVQMQFYGWFAIIQSSRTHRFLVSLARPRQPSSRSVTVPIGTQPT